MMSRMIVLPLIAVLAMAETKPLGSWGNVTAIRAGADVKVRRSGDKKTVRGRFAGADQESIRIDGKSGSVSIRKSEVESVSVARRKKGRNALIGAGVGGGVGALAVGGIEKALEKEDADSVAGAFALVGLVIGVIAGTALGLASGAGHATVYSTGTP